MFNSGRFPDELGQKSGDPRGCEISLARDSVERVRIARNEVTHGNERRNGLRGFSTWCADGLLQKELRLAATRSVQLACRDPQRL